MAPPSIAARRLKNTLNLLDEDDDFAYESSSGSEENRSRSKATVGKATVGSFKVHNLQELLTESGCERLVSTCTFAVMSSLQRDRDERRKADLGTTKKIAVDRVDAKKKGFGLCCMMLTLFFGLFIGVAIGTTDHGRYIATVSNVVINRDSKPKLNDFNPRLVSAMAQNTMIVFEGSNLKDCSISWFLKSCIETVEKYNSTCEEMAISRVTEDGIETPTFFAFSGLFVPCLMIDGFDISNCLPYDHLRVTERTF